MPSRPAVALILLFWLGTLGFTAHRDLWPRLFTDAPPGMAIDLADEANQSVQFNWKVYRGEKKVGSLRTWMQHVPADDTFRFTHKYNNLVFEFAGLEVRLPELTTTTRVARSGDLREQTMDGTLVIAMNRVELKAGAKVRGTVTDGVFTGDCELKMPPWDDISAPLDPVPVPGGQALSPLQPVNRVANVRPGRRWVVQEIDPLGEALNTLIRRQLGQQGVNLPERKREPLVAEVLPRAEALAWAGESVPCWVIEYRSGEARARTWVRVSDGRVLRQEALLGGERLAIEREE